MILLASSNVFRNIRLSFMHEFMSCFQHMLFMTFLYSARAGKQKDTQHEMKEERLEEEKGARLRVLAQVGLMKPPPDGQEQPHLGPRTGAPLNPSQLAP